MLEQLSPLRKKLFMTNSEDTSIDSIMSDAMERMEKSMESLKREFSTIRAARASTGMVEHVQVEYYGSMVPLNQVATISIPEPRMIMITPFDKSAMKEIEKSILKSDLNLTPQNDGSVIRLILPELTMERRQELVKQVKGKLEESKVSLRNIRRDANDEVKKMSGKGHSEDEIKASQDDIQKMTNEYSQKLDELASQKEESILSV